MIIIKKFKKLYQTNASLATFCGLSVAVFALGFMLFSFKYLLPNTEIVKAEEPTITPITNIVTTKKSILEIHIANNGMAYIQGARVLSVSGNTIIVVTTWNTVTLEWKITTNEYYVDKRHFGTSFLNTKGKNISITNVKVGDFVTVSGDLDTHSQGLVVKADIIRTAY